MNVRIVFGKLPSIHIFLFLTLLSACSEQGESRLARAEQLAEKEPGKALQCLDSIESPRRLRIADLANYYFLKWHATFNRDGELRDFPPIPKIAEYWEQRGKLHKAGYAYLYNGLLVKPRLSSEHAAIYFDKAARLATEQADSTLLFYSYYYRGKLFFRNHEMDNGEKMFEKALQYVTAHRSSDKPHRLFKVANSYLHTGNFEKAKEIYSLLSGNMSSELDSLTAAKILYGESYRIRDKKARQSFVDYLNSIFEGNIYRNMADARVALRKGKPDAAWNHISALPRDTIMKMPEMALPYYRLVGRYYFEKGDYKECSKVLKEFFQVSDSLKMNTLHNQLDHILYDYMQAKLEGEATVLKNQRNLLVTGGLALLSCCLAAGFWLYVSRKRKEERAVEAEKRMETLQELVQLQKDKEDDIKCLLMDRLKLSHRLVCLSSQETPGNMSFLKQYDKMLGDAHSSVLNWEDFYLLIDCVYDDFHRKLLQHFPDFSEKEVQTLCLLKGGFRSEEIAFVMNTTVASVPKRKTMLRKKLGLEDRADILKAVEKVME